MESTRMVKTRIAPSPTGAPHIGTAYIALFNYCFARRAGGKFVLRIEDTDQTRSAPEWEKAILDALRWAGVPWDEGPDVGGPCGPYRQSERLPIYREHAMRLVGKGAAFPCFCTAERLDALRKQQTAEKRSTLGYDGLCASIPPSEAQDRVAKGEPHVIRMRVPADGECVFRDRLRGEIRIPWAQVDQQVLLKTDGFPTYHLAVVVDDHLMEITHVIRGEEWISSTPKHVLLYQHFGWTPPEFAHLPLLRNPDKSKLSKRKNPTSILYYQRAGFLPEAVLNYLGLMAYSLPDGREVFSRDEMAATFDIDRVSMGGPVFDLAKLMSFNGQYLRRLSPEGLLARLKEWMLNDDVWSRAVPLAQPRLDKMSDLVPMTAFLFADRLPLDPALIALEGLPPARTAEVLKLAQWQMENLRPWTRDAIKGALAQLSEKESIPLKSLLKPFFVAMSGAAVSLPLFDSMEILGRDLAVRRLQYAQEAAATAGATLNKDALRKLEGYFARAYGAAGQAGAGAPA